MLWPTIRVTVRSAAGSTSPDATTAAVLASAATSLSVKATSSSSMLAKPRARHSSLACSGEMPARSAACRLV